MTKDRPKQYCYVFKKDGKPVFRFAENITDIKDDAGLFMERIDKEHFLKHKELLINYFQEQIDKKIN